MQRTWPALFCALLISSGAVAADRVFGPGDSGGGDEVGLEFHSSFQSSLEIIRVSGWREFDQLQRIDWAKALKGIKILTTDRKLFVTSDGVKQEVVALNTPSKKMVEVSRARWKALASPRKKEGIALHEILSLIGLERTGFYPYSGLFLAKFGQAPDPVFGGDPARVVPFPSVVSQVFPYRCRRRFVEGEGVVENSVQCMPGQHLGFITAEYTFYLFRSTEGNNFSSKHSESFYPAPICGIQNVSRFTCEHTQEAEFGLSAKQEGAFVAGVWLSSSPSGDGPLSALYGFAALPDQKGQCPANLVAARPYLAQPQSLIEPLPTNFINSNNSLNNILIRTKDRGAPANFEVWRQPSNQPCGMDGTCQWPDAGMTLAQSVSYFPLTPVVCVIPKSSLPQGMRKP